MEVNRIAYIYNGYQKKFGIPRQSGLVDSVLSRIVFEPEYRDSNSVRGLEEYSHLWLIWEISENERGDWSPTVRPPRLGGNKRMGVFATRSPFRPNPIGLSCVEFDHMEMEEEGPVLYVRGADLMNGTPILDIKPYLSYADSHPEATSGFAGQVLEYRMKVEIEEDVLRQIPEEERDAVREILAQDPRPGYQKNPDRIYGMGYAGMELKFRAEEDRIILISVEKEK